MPVGGKIPRLKQTRRPRAHGEAGDGVRSVMMWKRDSAGVSAPIAPRHVSRRSG
jgi:hypothetical protein